MKINFEILLNYYFDIPNFLFHPAAQGQCQGQDLHSLHDHTPCTSSITPKNIGCYVVCHMNKSSNLTAGQVAQKSYLSCVVRETGIAMEAYKQ